MTSRAATEEVRYLALVLRRNQFRRERQRDVLPPLRLLRLVLYRHEVLRSPLIPHTIATAHRVADRTVEVLLVYEQMVVGCRLVFQYQVSVDG